MGKVWKDRRKRHGKECLGQLRPKLKCMRARDGSGDAVALNGNCRHCGEQRCKAHCKCARDGSVNAKGRKAARGVSAEKPAHRGAYVAKPSPPSAPTVPVGRASAPSCVLMDASDWYEKCCDAISKASEVELASYMYDNGNVQAALVKRLRGRSAFQVNIYIDAGTLAGKTPRAQRARLAELRSLGGVQWKVQFDMEFCCILVNLDCLAGLLGPTGVVCGRQLLAKPLLKACPDENWRVGNAQRFCALGARSVGLTS